MCLIKPKAEEIFLQTVSMLVFQLKFSSIDTPRDLVKDTCLKTRRLVSSVGRAPVCCAGGRGFDALPL